MFEQNEKLEQGKAEIVNIVRTNIVKGFVDMYSVYAKQMQTFNNAMCMMPRQYLPVGNPRDLFYEDYNKFCIDILMLFDRFIAKEANFNKLMDGEVPQHLMEYWLNGELELHPEELNAHLGQKVKEVISEPFFSTLANRLTQNKIGDEKFKQLKVILDANNV